MQKTWKKSLVFISRKFMILGLIMFLCVGCKREDSVAELTEITEDMSTSAKSKDKEVDGSVQDDGTSKDNGQDDNSQTDKRSSIAKEKDQDICVHVCGAVVTSGVYRLPSGSRLYEAVLAAGGLREDADDTSLNQASVVEDGQQIYVPTKEEVQNGTFKEVSDEGSKAGAGEVEGKVNINTADKEQLMTLRGIGESKATAIINYRETQGSFQSIEELMQIEGIKEGVFQKIRDMITI